MAAAGGLAGEDPQLADSDIAATETAAKSTDGPVRIAIFRITLPPSLPDSVRWGVLGTHLEPVTESDAPSRWLVLLRIERLTSRRDVEVALVRDVLAAQNHSPLFALEADRCVEQIYVVHFVGVLRVFKPPVFTSPARHRHKIEAAADRQPVYQACSSGRFPQALQPPPVD